MLPYISLQAYLNGEPALSMMLQLAIPSYSLLSDTDLKATVFLPTSDVSTGLIWVGDAREEGSRWARAARVGCAARVRGGASPALLRAVCLTPG